MVAMFEEFARRKNSRIALEPSEGSLNMVTVTKVRFPDLSCVLSLMGVLGVLALGGGVPCLFQPNPRVWERLSVVFPTE